MVHTKPKSQFLLPMKVAIEKLSFKLGSHKLTMYLDSHLVKIKSNPQNPSLNLTHSPLKWSKQCLLIQKKNSSEKSRLVMMNLPLSILIEYYDWSLCLSLNWLWLTLFFASFKSTCLAQKFCNECYLLRLNWGVYIRYVHNESTNKTNVLHTWKRIFCWIGSKGPRVKSRSFIERNFHCNHHENLRVCTRNIVCELKKT